MFARRRYGEDALGWYCPTDEGLKRVIELSYTESLDDQYPLFVVLMRPMRVAKVDLRFRRLERVACEGLDGAMARGKSVQFRQSVSAGEYSYGYQEYYSPCQVQKPQLLSVYGGQAFVDLCGVEFPDKRLLKEKAIELTDNGVRDIDPLYEVVIFSAWASRSSIVRDKIADRAWDRLEEPEKEGHGK